MAVTPAKILTAETIPAYLAERLNDLKGVVDSVDAIAKVEPITGGNVNYAFCITLDDGMKLFLKQAPEFVAIFGPDGFPLTSERMQREMDVYTEWQSILAKGGEAAQMLPDICYFDSKHLVSGSNSFENGHSLCCSPNMLVTNALQTLIGTMTIIFLLSYYLRAQYGRYYAILGRL